MISESPEEKFNMNKRKTFKYPKDVNQTHETRNSNIGGTITKNVFKTPSAKAFESTGPRLEDINVMDSWPQSQPKFHNQNIMTDHQMQIGGHDIGTIRKTIDPRASLEI